MSFSEYRASGGRFDPKTEYERLYQLKLQHGFTVPVMEGFEQYGLKYTDKRGTLNINNPAFNGVKDYRSKFVTSKKRVDGKFKWFDSRTGKVFDVNAAKEYIAEKNDIAAKAYYQEEGLDAIRDEATLLCCDLNSESELRQSGLLEMLSSS